MTGCASATFFLLSFSLVFPKYSLKRGSHDPFIARQYSIPNPFFIIYFVSDGAWGLGGDVYVAETKIARLTPTSIGQFILPLYNSRSSEMPEISAARLLDKRTDSR